MTLNRSTIDNRLHFIANEFRKIAMKINANAFLSNDAKDICISKIMRTAEEVRSAIFLKENDLINYLLTSNLKYANVLDEDGLYKQADHITTRLSPFRKNYDYDEGWNTIMDDFRSGKIKDMKDFINKKRKKRKTAAVQPWHVLPRGFIGDLPQGDK